MPFIRFTAEAQLREAAAHGLLDSVPVASIAPKIRPTYPYIFHIDTVDVNPRAVPPNLYR